MVERENPPMIWFKIGKAEGVLGEYRGFFGWEEVIDKIKPLVKNNGMNLFIRSEKTTIGHALECNEFKGPTSIYVYWGDEFGKMEHTISDNEVAMLNLSVFQGTLSTEVYQSTIEEEDIMTYTYVAAEDEGKFMIALAQWGCSGFQWRPEHGEFVTLEDAQEHANQLNKALFKQSKEESDKIVSKSIELSDFENAAHNN